MKRLAVFVVAMAPATAFAQNTEQAPVSDATAAPYPAICHLYVKRSTPFSGSSNNSTAFLYRERYLITAAHNVYSPAYNRARHIGISCGVTEADQDKPQQVVDYRNVRVASGYFWRRWSRDFAVVRLDRALTGNAGFALPADDVVAPDTPGRIAGFPGRSGDAGGMTGQRLFAGAGTVRRNGSFLSYDIETATGNSGGPVWTEATAGPVALGVHIRPSGARFLDATTRREIDRMIVSLERGGQQE